MGLVGTSVLCAAIHFHSQKLSVLVKILVRLSNDGTEFEQSLHLVQFSTPGSVVPSWQCLLKRSGDEVTSISNSGKEKAIQQCGPFLE